MSIHHLFYLPVNPNRQVSADALKDMTLTRLIRHPVIYFNVAQRKFGMNSKVAIRRMTHYITKMCRRRCRDAEKKRVDSCAGNFLNVFIYPAKTAFQNVIGATSSVNRLKKAIPSCTIKSYNKWCGDQNEYQRSDRAR